MKSGKKQIARALSRHQLRNQLLSKAQPLALCTGVQLQRARPSPRGGFLCVGGERLASHNWRAISCPSFSLVGRGLLIIQRRFAPGVSCARGGICFNNAAIPPLSSIKYERRDACTFVLSALAAARRFGQWNIFTAAVSALRLSEEW